MEILSAAVTEVGRIELLKLETPELCGREVLVKVRAVALCTLEQRVFKGEVRMPYPCCAGHEVSGEIAELGPSVDTKVWKIGDRVAVRLLYSCGECHECRSGRTNMCVKAQRKPVRSGLLPGPGGCCNYVIVNSDALFSIPDDLSYEKAALTEPLSCVVHSINRAGVNLADDVVVIGGGIMGQLHVMLARMRGARVILSEMNPGRRNLALKHGADVVVDPSQCNIVEKIREICGGRGADVVFNTTPVPQVFAQAVQMVARHGTMVQYSSLHPDVPVELRPQYIHNNEINIIGSISPMVQDFYTANMLLSKHLVDVSDLIEETLPFKEAQMAYEHSVMPGKFRVIISD